MQVEGNILKQRMCNISVCRHKTFGSVHIILEFLEMHFCHLEQNVPMELLAAGMKILS